MNVHERFMTPCIICAIQDVAKSATKIILTAFDGRYPYIESDTGQVARVQCAYCPNRGSKTALKTSMVEVIDDDR